MSTPTKTISGMTAVPIKSKFTCAVIGDSLVWGQGLKPEEKFCYLAAKELAQRAEQTFSPPEMRARSGAKIAVPPALGSGLHFAFTQVFPELFGGVGETDIFIAGNDRAADNLEHEIPAPFPLIPTQLEMLGKGPRRDIDVLFINGGANDVEFETVLHPDGPDLLHIHADLRHRVYYPLRDLLVKARRKCPNALIVVPGYFPLMTMTGTHRGPVARFIDWHMKIRAKHRPTVLTSAAVAFLGQLLSTGSPWAGLVRASTTLLISEHLVKDGIESFFGEEIRGLNDLAEAMRMRAAITSQLLQFWMARAVAEARQIDDVRGPGILFVNPRFDDVNAIFGSNSFVYGDYDPPKDPVADERMAADPRAPFVNSLKELLRLLEMTAVVSFIPPSTYFYENAEKIRQELRSLGGPATLVALLADDNVMFDQEERAQLIGLLKAELLRLKFVRIASFIHPNERGSKRYADRIIADVRTYQYEYRKDSNFDSMVTGLGRMIGEPLPTPAETLRAFGLDPNAPRGENMQLIYPDIVTVVVYDVKPPKGERWATMHVKNFKTDAPKSVTLTMLRQPNNNTTVLTGDAGGLFFLGAYTRCWIDVSVWVEGRHRVEMFVNGHRVLDTEVVTTGRGNLQLPYPAAIPGRPDPPPIDPDLVT